MNLINVGTFPNDATGDPLQVAFTKVNGLAAGTVPFSSLTIGPPASGIALTVNGVASSNTMLVNNNGSGYGIQVSNNNAGGGVAFKAIGLAATSLIALQWQQTGQQTWQIYTPASTNDLRFLTAGADRFIITGNGNTTIPAPTGGAFALTVQGVGSGTQCLTLNDSTNTNGANILLTGNGTNPNKYIRAQSGSLQVLNNAYSAQLMAITDAGNVSMGPPTSGAVLSVTGSGASGAMAIFAAATNSALQFDSTNATGSFIVCTRSGSQIGFLGNGGALGGNLDHITLRGQTAIDFVTNAGAQLAGTIASAGNWTVNAPTSGNAFTVNTFSGARGLQINNSGNQPSAAITGGTSLSLYIDNTTQGAGTAAIRIDNSVTTGAQTATFAATNKPGTGTTAPTEWLPINMNGTVYYIPCWQ